MITRTDTPHFLSPQSLAVRWDTAPRTIYKWIESGILPAAKVGPKMWRVEMSVVVAFERGQLRGGPDACST